MSDTWQPTGATRVAAVIGDPVRHSLSPVMHNAAFRTAGIDWVFLAFEVPEGGAPAALDAMRTFGIGGLSVTMPHKRAAAHGVDELSDTARTLEAVNCVVPAGDGRLRGENTDGEGFLASMVDAGAAVQRGSNAVVFGAGGAGRAVILALADAGCAQVAVVNRTRGRAVEAVALAPDVVRVADASAVRDADLIVNATSVGLGGEGGSLVDPAALREGQVVVDLVYHPSDTALLRAARAAGATAVDGVGMLVHQGAAAFRLWTGLDAPVEAMATAVRAQLGT